jgi:hypothetical protein
MTNSAVQTFAFDPAAAIAGHIGAIGSLWNDALEHLTLIRIFEELRSVGYAGSYAAVRRYAIAWREKRAGETANAYVPLSFAPGEAYQFDWSHEVVVMDRVTTIVKAAHVRLCHSRMMVARAYPRETQEMVFDDRHGALLDADMTADALILLERQLKHGESGAPRSWTSTWQAWRQRQ